MYDAISMFIARLVLRILRPYWRWRKKHGPPIQEYMREDVDRWTR